MARSRYLITEADKPHFLTCTIVAWLPVFTRPDCVQQLLDCWTYQRHNAGFKLFGYVVMENHLHYVAQAPNLQKCVASFKAYTARQIIDDLQSRQQTALLQQLR